MILPTNTHSELEVHISSQPSTNRKDVIRKSSTKIDYNYRVADQVLLINKVEFKYQAPLNVP